MQRFTQVLAFVAALGMAGSALASQSTGFYRSGGLVNGVQIPDTGEHHYILYPERCYLEGALRHNYTDPNKRYNTWAHKSTVDVILDVAKAVRTKHPDSPLIPVGELSSKFGGKISQHNSHQNGLDVDLWYIQNPWLAGDRFPECSRGIRYESKDPNTGQWFLRGEFPLNWNWTLMAELAKRPEVKVIFVGGLIRDGLLQYARETGVDSREYKRTERKLHAVKCKIPARYHKGYSTDSYKNNYCPHDEHLHVRFHCPEGSPSCREKL